MNFLDKIIAIKQKEIKNLKNNLSLCQIRDKCLILLKKHKKKHGHRALKKAIVNADPIGLIAEIKLASPSKGKLTNLSCKEIARLYSASAADAISVLTDKTYFNGNINYLRTVRDIAPQPIFRKDFIIDQYQIYETAMAGGDAFLLIAAILDSIKLKEFITLGNELGLESIVEVHTKEEIKKAVNAGADIIGINNRNLSTMDIDISTTEKLMPYIPQEKIVISESGIVTPNDVERVLGAGVHGILVGTSIIESKKAIEKIADLKALIHKK